MSRIEDIESQVRELSSDELRAFRDWFARYDADRWDAQFEQDVRAGKLDRFAERALQDHRDGSSSSDGYNLQISNSRS